jgi:CRISPR-associated protein Cas2
MRNRYIVAYDIADDRRWRDVYRLMRGHGDRIQYSVFRCDLAPIEKARLVQSLIPVIDRDDDQILFIDIGPADGRGQGCIDSLGKPYIPPHRGAIIV